MPPHFISLGSNNIDFMKIRLLTIPALTIILLLLPACNSDNGKNPYEYVNPFIGTGGIVHTFPGAVVPFGMVQLSPDTGTEVWNWCSGYHYSDSSFLGFSHTQLSGTGWADLGDILIMASTGEPLLEPGSKENPSAGYRSSFLHSSESASPGYYSVILEDYGIKAEMTASDRTGWHRYSFPAGGGNIIIDPVSKIFGRTLGTSVEIVNDSTLKGFCRSSGWGGNRTTWFVAQFSEPFDSFGTGNDEGLSPGNRADTAAAAKAWVTYNNNAAMSIELKVAISLTGQQGAYINLGSDPSNNFDEAREAARIKWVDALSAITVESDNPDDLAIFYTALYHSMIHPSINSDFDGSYYSGGKVHKAEGFTSYSSFSLWDTFRAVHPLFTIIDHSRTADFVNSLISRYEQGDQLPIWELCGYDNRCMIGYPSVAVIADAVIKEIDGIDSHRAYEAMRSIAFHPKLTDTGLPGGLEEYLEYGYVTADIPQSVSKTMEFAYYDWCIARVAEKIGEVDDARMFYSRSLAFMKHYNSDKGLFWPRNADGSWLEDMSLTSWEDLKQHYISGNIWAYSLFFPHATTYYARETGGEENLYRALERTFETPLVMDGEQHVDISGFTGLYGHGDEPGHHIAYLYNYTANPSRTADRVKEITDTWYFNRTDGMPNNDDCGQMSSWYIFSSLGFYPVCPGDTIYLFGSPRFSRSTLKLPSGRTFVIEAPGITPGKIYIQSVTLNGREKKEVYLSHGEIMKGGILRFEMGDEPNPSWGVLKEERPVSVTGITKD